MKRRGANVPRKIQIVIQFFSLIYTVKELEKFQDPKVGHINDGDG